MIYLFIIIITQMAYISYTDHLHRKERTSLLNRIQAADVRELKILEEKPKPKKEKEEKPIQFV